MKAVIETATGKALYLFGDTDDVQITDAGMTGPIRAMDLRPSTHSVVTATQPAFFVGGGVMQWDDGWVILDQAAYDAALLSSANGARAIKLAAVFGIVASKVATGCPILNDGDTLHIQMDDGSRANLTAMAATAIAAMSGSIGWPASYALGWITTEDVRIPLDTPSQGLALANMVGDYYAAVVQRGRDLKDAVLAATTPAEIEAIDINAGWPDAPGEPIPVTSTPLLIAQARLTIDGGLIGGFGTESGLAGAVALDTGLIAIEFVNPVNIPYLVWLSDGGAHRIYSVPSEQFEAGFLIHTEDLEGNPDFPAQIQILVTKS